MGKKFDTENVTNALIEWIRSWFETNGKGCNVVIGMSGGKDSTIVAALCAKALGSDRVIGVAMPDDSCGQGLNDADKICEYLGIKFLVAPIGESVKAIANSIGGFGFELSEQTVQNIPPRIRMTTLYAISQSNNGRVVNTCNLSEDLCGYFTKAGDEIGDFSPLGKLTVTEALAIGDYLGLPKEWVHKTPDDGLPHSTSDEVKLGFTYTTLDKYIRNEGGVSSEDLAKIQARIKANAFKLRKMSCFEYNP